MKKIFKSLVVTMIMVFSLSTVAFAAPANTTAKDVQNSLKQIGVPDSYIGNVVEYLQKVTITDAQVNSLMAKIDEAKALIGSEKDLSQLPESTKQSLFSLAVDAGNILGLKVTYTRDSGKGTTFTVTDAAGKKILVLNSVEAKEIVKNLKFEAIEKALKDAASFSNNPEKGSFDPITGKPNKTATGYGATMAAGAFLVLAGAGALVVSRKRAIA